jgi:hypothetical protein
MVDLSPIQIFGFTLAIAFVGVPRACGLSLNCHMVPVQPTTYTGRRACQGRRLLFQVGRREENRRLMANPP